VIRLRAGDIDSAQNIIRIVQSKGRKDRLVMLPPCVLALSRQWFLRDRDGPIFARRPPCSQAFDRFPPSTTSTIRVQVTLWDQYP
jgi:integrase